MTSLAYLQFSLYLGAFILGIIFFARKKSPLYFRLLFYSTACFLLEEVYNFTDYICTGEWIDSFSFAAFGAGAGYAFMLSANYGLFDSIVDDGSKGCKRARKLAFLAPLVLITVFVVFGIKYFRITGKVLYVILLLLSKLPAFFASYYHMKHLILPDVISFMVNPLRLCNAACLIIILSDILSDVLFAFNNQTGYAVFETVFAVSLIIMMITAERGRREWKI